MDVKQKITDKFNKLLEEGNKTGIFITFVNQSNAWAKKISGKS